MTSERSPERLQLRPDRSLEARPGLRTFASQRFRMIVAVSLLIAALSIHALRLVAFGMDPEGQYGIDFEYWYISAVDARSGLSPYPQRYLEGSVPVTDFGYRYPPTFAQALIPLTTLSLLGATHAWAAIQIGLGFLSVWLAGLFGGARRGLEYLLWSGVAVALFQPFFDTVHKGNVSAVQAFQVSLILAGGALAGVSLATAVLLKSTPFSLVPAALLHGGRLRLALVASGFLIAGLSFVAAPQAWLDFLRIQPNLFAGPYVVHYNLQPASLVATALPDLPALADGVRAVTLVVAVAALGSSIILARRPGGWPAAVVLGVSALILIPGAIWYHYLAVLLPLAAFAWPRATDRQRAALVAGAAGITLGLVWLPIVSASAAFLVLTVFGVVAPRPWLSRPIGSGQRRGEGNPSREPDLLDPESPA